MVGRDSGSRRDFPQEPRLVRWPVLAAQVDRTRGSWTWLDDPIAGQPRVPVLLRELTGAEERSLIGREWR